MRVAFCELWQYPGYGVTKTGEVWSRRGTRDWKRLSPGRKPCGHLLVALRVNNRQVIRLVHRLVLEAFVGPCPDGMECRHLNGIPNDNRLSNLRWGTRKQNCRDQKKHGVAAVGARNGHARLTAKIVRRCRVRASKGATVAELARNFGVSYMTMWAAVRGKSWTDIPLQGAQK